MKLSISYIYTLFLHCFCSIFVKFWWKSCNRSGKENFKSPKPSWMVIMFNRRLHDMTSVDLTLCPSINYFIFPLHRICVIAHKQVVAEWLRPLIFSALNRSSSHRCGLESRLALNCSSSLRCGFESAYFGGECFFLCKVVYADKMQIKCMDNGDKYCNITSHEIINGSKV